MRVWVDIDNPPQVQYLVPLGHAFERAGADVVFTARDHGITIDLLLASESTFHVVGSQFGASKASKALGLLRRTRSLARLLRQLGSPNVLVSASRPSAAAAKRLGIPAFIVCDYEYVNLAIYRVLGANLLFPDLIGEAVFKDRHFRDSQLMPFRGLKEDLTFAEVSLDDFTPHLFPGVADDAVRVLFRPPAEESHYHRKQSSLIAQELLEKLAADPGIVVVFSPRYEWQRSTVEGIRWGNDPVVLREAIPFLPLLMAVDLVISAGGTMLREAAYLGVPAYSLFQGPTGAVDRHLESIGRLELVTSSADFRKIKLERTPRRTRLEGNPQLADDIATSVLERVAGETAKSAKRRKA